MTEQTWRDYTSSGVDFFKQSDYKDAFEQFLSSLNAAIDARQKVQSLHNLAMTSFNLSRLKEGRDYLSEALAICSTDDSLQLLKACLLNTLGRYLGEIENYDEADRTIVEAIEIARPLNLLYACEMASNLAHLRQSVPEWQGRDEQAIEQFAQIENLDQKIEIALDLLGGFRVPSPSFDMVGAPNPEVFQTRLAMMRANGKTNPERREAAEKVVEIQKETLAVSPNMMAHVYTTLATIAFENADYLTAAEMSDKAIEVINQSYLRSHAMSCFYLNKATTAMLISGDAQRAAKLLKDAEDLAREKCGENSATHLRSKDFRLMLSAFVGGVKTSVAEQIDNLESSIHLYSKIYPDGHTAILHLRLMIIKKSLEENRFEKAEETLEKCRAAIQRNFRPLVSAHRVMSIEAMLRFKQGRSTEGQALLSLLEEYALGDEIKKDQERIDWLLDIAEQYGENALNSEAERLARLALVVAERITPPQQEIIRKVRQQLGLVLTKVGKAIEAGQLLAELGQANTKSSPEIAELEDAIKQATRLHTSGERDKAAILAVQTINKARPHLPKTEQIIVMCSSILIDQAKAKKDGPEIVRITSMLSDMPQTIRLRAIMPVYYKEAAQAFAATRDIKAEALFEQAIKLSEETSTYSNTLDDCLYAYQLFCTDQNKPEKAAHLLERVIELRLKHDGPNSLKYASAISHKALHVSSRDAQAADQLSRQAVAIFAKNPDAELIQHFIALTTAHSIATQLKQTEYAEELKERVKKLKEKLDKSFAGMKEFEPVQD